MDPRSLAYTDKDVARDFPSGWRRRQPEGALEASPLSAELL